VSEVFKIKSDLIVKGYKEKTEWVPEVDNSYVFDQETTLSILAGFQHNRRVMVQGFHGTGKSTHIEQVAARLNWPCVRINLDSHISRIDLLGKDVIKLKDGKQITEFQEGLLPWSIQNPVALVFDEYDAGRPDVMFVIQRILEVEGKLTLLDQNKVINPHPSFRLFATTNTIGLGDVTGLYHGTQQINQGQLDRWHILSSLNYLSPAQEFNVVSSRLKKLKSQKNKTLIKDMIQLANLTRAGFINGDISTIMSPRTVISWAENFTIFKDISASFKLSFFNKCDDTEKPIIAEYYQRCFGEDIQEKRPD
jgi:cobaltochelatase CobS